MINSIPKVPLVAHIPHSSTHIPLELRADILLSNDELDYQLHLLTDWFTDELFACVNTVGGTSAIHDVSRLIVDPERFSDDELEFMARHGMGAVYEKCYTLGPKPIDLRNIPKERRGEYLDRFYKPHHKNLETQVQDTLSRFGKCMIIDGHSFPSRHGLYKTFYNKTEFLNDICIGTDDVHTPSELLRILDDYFKNCGLTVEINMPFSGSIVPSRFYKTNDAVNSIMIEVNRKLYMDEKDHQKTSSFEEVKEMIANAVELINSYATF